MLWLVPVVFHSFIMEKVDLVIVGAEGVAESGGIINKVLTWSTGLLVHVIPCPVCVERILA